MGGSQRHTICWSCAKAVGGCSWSQSFIPIHRWCAIKTKLKSRNKDGEPIEHCSYIVIDCPEFVADATHEGLKRLPKVENQCANECQKKNQ